MVSQARNIKSAEKSAFLKHRGTGNRHIATKKYRDPGTGTAKKYFAKNAGTLKAGLLTITTVFMSSRVNPTFKCDMMHWQIILQQLETVYWHRRR